MNFGRIKLLLFLLYVSIIISCEDQIMFCTFMNESEESIVSVEIEVYGNLYEFTSMQPGESIEFQFQIYSDQDYSISTITKNGRYEDNVGYFTSDIFTKTQYNNLIYKGNGKIEFQIPNVEELDL